MRYGRGVTVQSDCLKGRVVCGWVYGDMHLKDLLGLIVRVGYCVPVPDIYLVLHGLLFPNRTLTDLSINHLKILFVQNLDNLIKC